MAPLPSAATSFTDLMKVAESTSAVRKSLQILVFVGRKSAVTIPATPAFDAAGKITLPTGLFPLGILDPKGVELTPKTEKSEIEGYNYADPVRTDVIKITREMAVTTLEPDRAEVQELIRGMKITNKAPDATSKTVTFDEPALPADLDYVAYVLIRDINKATGSEYLDGRIFPKVSLSERGNESFTKTGAKVMELKFSCSVDPATGTPCRHILGGPGFNELASVLGYAA